MSDSRLDLKLGQLRAGTEGLAPRPELVEAIQGRIRAEALAPTRALTSLDGGGSSLGTRIGLLVGLILTLGLGLLLGKLLWPRPPIALNAYMGGLNGPLEAPTAPDVGSVLPIIGSEPSELVRHPGPEAAAEPSPTVPRGVDQPVRPALRPARRTRPAPVKAGGPQGATPLAPPSSAPVPAPAPSPGESVPPYLLRLPAEPESPQSKVGLPYEPAFPFDARTLDGQRRSLRELRGKVVVLNLWSIYCGYCFDEIPQLINVMADHRSEPDIVFLSFAANTEEELREALARQPFPYEVVADPTEQIIGNFAGGGWPRHVVIDREGRILEGAAFSDSRGVRALLNRAIALASNPPEQLQELRPVWGGGECAFSGEVRAREDGAAVPRAWVSLRLRLPRRPGGVYWEPTRATHADAAGRFKLEGLTCGEYDVDVAAHRRERLSDRLSFSGREVASRKLLLEQQQGPDPAVAADAPRRPLIPGQARPEP